MYPRSTFQSPHPSCDRDKCQYPQLTERIRGSEKPRPTQGHTVKESISARTKVRQVSGGRGRGRDPALLHLGQHSRHRLADSSSLQKALQTASSRIALPPSHVLFSHYSSSFCFSSLSLTVNYIPCLRNN